MFLAYHPRWHGPRLYEEAERVTYATMGYPLLQYVVVKFDDYGQRLAALNALPDKEFSKVQKYLEEL